MLQVLGGDTESINGPPFLLQFFSNQLGIRSIISVDVNTVMTKFLEFLDELSNNNIPYAIYFINLKFDARAIFYNNLDILAQECFNWFIPNTPWRAEGVYSNICFINFYNKDTGKTVYLRDVSAYFMGSLKKLANIFCPDLPKLEKPEGLGNIINLTKSAMDYYIRDSEIVSIIGEEIQRRHILFDIGQSLSAPHFASKVFRHRFLLKEIPLPENKINYPALHSYHGGRNGLYVKSGFYKNVYGIDLISAYPWAMTKLPDFSDLKKYSFTDNFHDISEIGIYKIWGRVKKCKYPVLFSHDFKPLKNGDVEGIWVTGCELLESIKSNEFKLKKFYGYTYFADKQDFINSPFKSYALFFFEKKNTAENSVDRQFYKILLNSLYGKFVEMQKVLKNETICFDEDDKLTWKDDYKTGALFNPFIATLITAFVRVKIHQLEHEYESMHTSTDGIFSLKKPSESNCLGGLKQEFYGDVLLFRNKLYIVYGEGEGTPSSIFKKNIVKYAKHGYNGSIEALEKMYHSNNWEYTYNHCNTLKESLKRGLIVNKFVERKAILNIKEM